MQPGQREPSLVMIECRWFPGRCAVALRAVCREARVRWIVRIREVGLMTCETFGGRAGEPRRVTRIAGHRKMRAC